MGVAARQDNSYANKLRFLRGRISIASPQPNPKQALITPGVNNPESAYAVTVDGKLNLGYHQITAGGVDTINSICCAPSPPV